MASLTSGDTLNTPPVEVRILNRSPPRPREDDFEAGEEDRPNKMSRTDTASIQRPGESSGQEGLGLDGLDGDGEEMDACMYPLDLD